MSLLKCNNMIGNKAAATKSHTCNMPAAGGGGGVDVKNGFAMCFTLKTIVRR